MMWVHCLVAAASLIAATSVAEVEPYVRVGSIGLDDTTPQPCPDGDFVRRLARCWEGEQVIFLPARQPLQKYGYLDFSHVVDGQTEHPEYEELAGTVATVTEVALVEQCWLVTVCTEDGEVYVGRALDRDGSGEDVTLHGIAFLSDLEAARRHYLGAELWILNPVLGTYNALTDHTDYFACDPLEAVTVTDIVLGWYEQACIRFILRTAGGQEGFLDVQMSGTNTRKGTGEWDRFENVFSDRPPVVDAGEPNWPDRVRSAVAGRRVFVGMTKEQARRSWGDPAKVNRTTTTDGTSEQWVYDSGSYLYFENGLLVAIQN